MEAFCHMFISSRAPQCSEHISNDTHDACEQAPSKFSVSLLSLMQLCSCTMASLPSLIDLASRLCMKLARPIATRFRAVIPDPAHCFDLANLETRIDAVHAHATLCDLSFLRLRLSRGERDW